MPGMMTYMRVPEKDGRLTIYHDDDIGSKQRKPQKDQVLPGLEPGFWEDGIRIPSDNRYTTGPLVPPYSYASTNRQ